MLDKQMFRLKWIMYIDSNLRRNPLGGKGETHLKGGSPYEE